MPWACDDGGGGGGHIHDSYLLNTVIKCER